MGMFDSLFDADGIEWQTKAYDRNLDEYRVGDRVPALSPDLDAYQVEVLGGPEPHSFTDSWATVRNRTIVAVPALRDDSLPLFDYGGGLREDGAS